MFEEPKLEFGVFDSSRIWDHSGECVISANLVRLNSPFDSKKKLGREGALAAGSMNVPGCHQCERSVAFSKEGLLNLDHRAG